MLETVLPTKDEVSQSVHLEISKYGGHVGFVSKNLFNPECWAERQIKDYFFKQL